MKPEAKFGGQFENIDAIRRCIASLRAVVLGLLRLDLGANQAVTPDAADLMLYAEFESWQALHDYERHPLHDELRALIGPLRLERRVVDYEL